MAAALSIALLVTASILDVIPVVDTKPTVKKMPLTLPPGFGSKPLTTLAEAYRFDPEMVTKTIAFKGIGLKEKETLARSARNNDISPQTLYNMIREAALSQKA